MRLEIHDHVWSASFLGEWKVMKFEVRGGERASGELNENRLIGKWWCRNGKVRKK
jgi:hypothetical protein